MYVNSERAATHAGIPTFGSWEADSEQPRACGRGSSKQKRKGNAASVRSTNNQMPDMGASYCIGTQNSGGSICLDTFQTTKTCIVSVVPVWQTGIAGCF
jgi:hypothetical protein